jgi:hypothetical protein
MPRTKNSELPETHRSQIYHSLYDNDGYRSAHDVLAKVCVIASMQ